MKIMHKIFASKVMTSIVAVILGVLVGLILVKFTGNTIGNAVDSFIRAFTGINLKRGTFSTRDIGNLLSLATILCLAGLSVGFAFRTGLFNIGAEGQLVAGAFASVAVAVLIDAPKFIHLPLAILAGVVAGGLVGFIPGILKAKFNVHEVVICIMLNYIVLYLCNFLALRLPGTQNLNTAGVPETASLKNAAFEAATNSTLNNGFILMILAVIIFYIIIDRTTFGYSLKVIGYNRHAALYSGMNVNRGIVSSMIISGMFAGLAGTILMLGVQGYFNVAPASAGYGFTGIAVSLVGLSNPFGVLLSSFLFAGLNNAQQILSINDIPKEIAVIISASVLYFVALKIDITKINISKIFNKRGDK